MRRYTGGIVELPELRSEMSLESPVYRRQPPASSRWRLFLLLFAVACYIAFSSRALPDPLAGHFVASGAANGYMPRLAYTLLMLVFAVGLPLVLACVPVINERTPARRINLPNRDYWLAPERRATTAAALQAFMARAGMLLALFLAFVHALVVRANQVQPPHLPERAMIAGLIVFVLAMLWWSQRLIAFFRKIPD